MGRRIRRTSSRTQEHVGELSQILQETISGHTVVHAFGAEAYEMGRFRIADRLGRRRAFLLSLGIYSAFSLLSAFSPVADSVAILGNPTIPGGYSVLVVAPAGLASPPGALPTSATAPPDTNAPVASGSASSPPAVTPGSVAVGTISIVLVGLRQPVKPGLTYPVTLVFARGGSVTLPVPIGTSEEYPKP